MTTALGARPSNVPLPTGVTLRKRAADFGSVAYLGVDNYI